MARYVPSPAPTTDDIGQMARWLREEMERIRQSTDDIYTVVTVLKQANFALPQSAADALERLGKM